MAKSSGSEPAIAFGNILSIGTEVSLLSLSPIFGFKCQPGCMQMDVKIRRTSNNMWRSLMVVKGVSFRSNMPCFSLPLVAIDVMSHCTFCMMRRSWRDWILIIPILRAGANNLPSPVPFADGSDDLNLR